MMMARDDERDDEVPARVRRTSATNQHAPRRWGSWGGGGMEAPRELAATTIAVVIDATAPNDTAIATTVIAKSATTMSEAEKDGATRGRRRRRRPRLTFEGRALKLPRKPKRLTVRRLGNARDDDARNRDHADAAIGDDDGKATATAATNDRGGLAITIDSSDDDDNDGTGRDDDRGDVVATAMMTTKTSA
jgi:hypothetical protein